MKLRLSILEQSCITKSGNAADALTNSLNLAHLADKLGYESILFSEHHGVTSYASSSPELMSAMVLSATKRIKAGTAGIMMRNYSAYKISEWAKMLSMLYPDRFILGLGKAPGGLKDAIKMLNNGKLPTMNQQVSQYETTGKQIASFLKENSKETNGVFAQPLGLKTLPQIYWLGSGINSAEEAGKLGFSYSYSDFLKRDTEKSITKAYADAFNKDAYLPDPDFQVCIAVSVAETEKMAKNNAYGMAYQFLMAKKMLDPDVLYPYEDVVKKLDENDEWDVFNPILKGIIIGTPETISHKLNKISKFYKTDNILLLCNLYHENDRIFTFKTIMENN